MTVKIGFIVNPIAGMGGKVGLKGTDGVVKEAKKRGANPVASNRAMECLIQFTHLLKNHVDIDWFTCDNNMGKTVLDKVGISSYHVIYIPKNENTNADDTKKACKSMINQQVDIILFCGGDGTARDLVSIVKNKIPILGIPSGVKMHSAVFGINPQAAGAMLIEFINGRLRTGEVEIMDLDEDLYRKGIWKVRLFDTARGLIEPMFIQVGKQIFSEVTEESVKDELAEHIEDEMKEHHDTLYLLGSGGTIDYIARKLGMENTILGIDAVNKKKIIKKDVNEKQILELIESYKKIKIILSPIGAQGFLIGRGNLQLSPKVIKSIGIDNIIVVATPSKILSTPFLRVDSGDVTLDNEFYKQEMMMVVIGYRLFRVVHFQKPS